jgi:hypothetical protein
MTSYLPGAGLSLLHNVPGALLKLMRSILLFCYFSLSFCRTEITQTERKRLYSSFSLALGCVHGKKQDVYSHHR